MAFRNRIVRISQLVFDKLSTGLTGARIEIQTTGANANKVSFYTGLVDETSPALVFVTGTDTTPGSKMDGRLELSGPQFFFLDIPRRAQPPVLTLRTIIDTVAGSHGSVANISADRITLQTSASASSSADLKGIAFNGVEQCYTGTETALIGAAPPAGQPKLMKQDTVVANTGAGGEVNFDYPSGAFPNGIVSFIATPGDNAGGFDAFRYSATFSTKLHVAGYARAGAGAVVSQTIRLNYIAIGW